MPIRIACQSITWGPSQKDELPEVAAAVAKAGFQGIELGFRHIQDTPPATLKQILSDNGLALASSHMGGNLEDEGQAEGERKMLDVVLDYLNEVGTTLQMYSGLRYKDDAQFDADVAMINRAAAKCAERGVRFLYHNHDWEFADGARTMNGLLERAGDELGLVVDVGWAFKGGMDVVAFLDANKERIGALHFKDFATPLTDKEHRVDTVCLGDGVAPLEEIAEWTKANLSDIWVIAEQDRADVPAAEAFARNGAFLKRVFGV